MNIDLNKKLQQEVRESVRDSIWVPVSQTEWDITETLEDKLSEYRFE